MLPEAAYSDLFALQYKGQREFQVRFGRVDVLTIGYAVEVEAYGSWSEGARQAMAYAHQVNRLCLTIRKSWDGPTPEPVEPAVAVYGSLAGSDVQHLFRRAGGVLALFVLRGTVWTHIRSNTDARRAARMGADGDVSDAVRRMLIAKHVAARKPSEAVMGTYSADVAAIMDRVFAE